MENRILLEKYRVSLDAVGMPIELRRNAAGVTCKAEEIESGRELALEIVPAPPLSPEAREKIEADAIAARQINHVNIPRLYDFGFDERDLIYVTEFCEGTTADAWLATHGPMPIRAVLHVALQVVSALGAATFHLVMHRSIHPGNILILPGETSDSEWPSIKLLNFGRVAPRSSTRRAGIDKSAPFASPEQVQNGTVDFRSEIYSLGCTLWSLVTGVSPFNAPGKPVAPGQMAAAMRRFRGVPRKLRRLITDMAATDPDDRPLDPVVMTDRLEACLNSVERRERIAQLVGIPLMWQRQRVAKRVGPLAARPFAMATVVIALAAVAAFGFTKKPEPLALWKKFATRAPLGVPVGIPDAAAARGPVVASAHQTPAPTTPAPNESSPVAQYNNPAPMEASLLETFARTAPPAVAPTPRQEARPSQSPESRRDTVSRVKEERAPRAELVEPPPPTEGPNESVASSTVLPTFSRNAEGVPRAKLVEPPPPVPKKNKRVKERSESTLAESERAAIRKAASKRSRPMKITAEGDGALVRTPEGAVHAKLIGTTADGQWMLALPSRQILVVPPPPDFIPH